MARKKKRTYGTGCILERRNGLAIRWREPVMMPDGSVKRVLRYETLGMVSRKEAARTLRERQAQSEVPKAAPVSFGELASAWKTSVLPMYKYSTRKHHGQILRTKLLPRFGEMPLQRIDRQTVQRWAAELQGAGYAPYSIDHYHNVLSTVLTKGVEWGHIAANPALGVRLPKLVTVRPKWVLSPAQAGPLLALLAPVARTLVGLALLTGVRRGELFSLRWKSFDEARGILRIEEAIYEGVIDTPKTAKSVRTIPLSGEAVKLLKQWKSLARISHEWCSKLHFGEGKGVGSGVAGAKMRLS